MNCPADSMTSSEFLQTRESILKLVPEQTPEMRRAQLERLIRAYGPPLTNYLIRCRRLSIDMAEEVLQNFLMEKVVEPGPENNIASQFLARKGKYPEVRFRDYLRRSIRNYLCEMIRRKKLPTVNLDDEGEQLEDAQRDQMDEHEYDVTWANSLLNQVCVEVRAECHLKNQSQVWDVFYERLLRPIETGMPPASYEDLCSQGRFESPKKAANLYMTAIRKFNRVLKGMISDYLPSEGNPSPSAVEAELLELQKALATHGMLQIRQHTDFSINESLNSMKQRLLSIPESVASLWNTDDLENLWHTLRHGSIADLLTELTGQPPDISMSRMPEWNEPFHHLLTKGTPCLNVLRRIKDVSKHQASQAANSLSLEPDNTSVFPPSITMLLYGLSIAVARVRLNERITRDRDEQFVPRACRLLEFSWIDRQTGQLLRDWLELLRKSET